METKPKNVVGFVKKIYGKGVGEIFCSAPLMISIGRASRFHCFVMAFRDGKLQPSLINILYFLL